MCEGLFLCSRQHFYGFVSFRDIFTCIATFLFIHLADAVQRDLDCTECVCVCVCVCGCVCVCVCGCVCVDLIRAASDQGWFGSASAQKDHVCVSLSTQGNHINSLQSSTQTHKHTHTTHT